VGGKDTLSILAPTIHDTPGASLVDVVTTLSILIPVITSIATLAYWLGRKFASIEERFERINERIEKLERGFSSFRDVFIQYNEILLSLLEARGVLSKGEVLALKGILSPLRPHPTSKYYTEEVARRLDELLAKDPEELTLSDLRELERIGDLILGSSKLRLSRRDRARFRALRLLNTPGGYN
jgi:hypothetical protein